MIFVKSVTLPVMTFLLFVKKPLGFARRFERFSLLFFAMIFCFSCGAMAEDTCLDWFKNSGLSPASKDCVIKCDIRPKDMSTFTCADRCDEFCNPQNCVHSIYWKAKIKAGRPEKWDLPSEASIAWAEKEQNKLMEFLDRLPDQMESISFDGFYRMKKSVDITNPATTATSGNSVVLYDRAFDNPFFSTSRVLAHELGHVIYLSLSESERRGYQKALGWKSSDDESKTRPGDFVSSRAKDSADEDFAENINFLLFEPDFLKVKVPAAFGWFSKKFNASFKLKEDCRHEKK